MKLVNKPEELPEKSFVATIRVFDGVHLGHRAILARCLELAQGSGEDLVLTFSRHPRSVLAPGSEPRLLTVLEEKVRLLEAAGVSNLLVVTFDEAIQRLTAQEFLSRFLGARLRMLVVGFDVRVGRAREAGVEELARMAERGGFKLEVVRPVKDDGQPGSSTRIRGNLLLYDFGRNHFTFDQLCSVFLIAITGSSLVERFCNLHIILKLSLMDCLYKFRVFILPIIDSSLTNTKAF